MVSRDHTAFGWTEAFFKESMSRDAMTGTRIVFALRKPVQMPTSVPRRTLRYQGKGDLTFQERAERPPEHAHTMSAVTLE